LVGDNDLSVAKEIVERKKRTSKISLKDVADGLGVSYVMLVRWLENDKYHIHAEKLAHLCKILDDFTLLDVLEEQAGRVAFVVPNIKEPLAANDVIAVQRLVKEVGGALQALAETLEDHIVEDWEVKKTIPELEDVIRECVRLKYWLRERSIADRKKMKSPKLGAS
jgi:transcriptional regulator with XRE-family HTH domain